MPQIVQQRLFKEDADWAEGVAKKKRDDRDSKGIGSEKYNIATEIHVAVDFYRTKKEGKK